MLQFIDIKEKSRVPKYKQIVDSILSAIDRGNIKLNDRLPSVNELSIEFDISRDTVIKAYDHLKKRKVIDSIQGKGHFVRKNTLPMKAKIFLLFNKLSPHKKIIYDAFTQTLGDNAAIDFFIYDNNYRHFKKLVKESKQIPYTHYVMICHFEEGGDDVIDYIKREVPQEKLIVLDKRLDGLSNKVSCVYQNFERDIYLSLEKLDTWLKKYKRINLLLSKKTYHPKEIEQGFTKFCSTYGYEFEIIEEIEAKPIKTNTVYINLMEDDLVVLIRKIKMSRLTIGNDVGIISYNETPLKEVLLNGLTVISTDFENFGKRAAEVILKNQIIFEANPFYVIPRNSL